MAMEKFFDYPLQVVDWNWGKLSSQIYRRMTVVNGLFDSLLEMVFRLRKI